MKRLLKCFSILLIPLAFIFLLAGCNEKVESFYIDVNSSDIRMGTCSGIGTYSTGQTVTLKADPKSGSKFLAWMKDGYIVSRENPFVFTIEKSKQGTYTGIFDETNLPYKTITEINTNSIKEITEIRLEIKLGTDFNFLETVVKETLTLNQGSSNITTNSNFVIDFSKIYFYEINYSLIEAGVERNFKPKVGKISGKASEGVEQILNQMTITQKRGEELTLFSMKIHFDKI